MSDSLEASMMKRIGELKAENARLNVDVNELADGLKLASEVGIKMADEVTRLKAKVERLTKGHSTDFVRAEMYRHLLDENAKLKEEVMRMKNDAYNEGDILQKCCEHQKNRIDRLKAEVERLTEALNKFTNTPNGVHGVEVKVSFWSKSGCRLPSSFSTFWMNAEKGQP